ncbi:MAG: LacI family DNA-binding transcriptional regulator [Anaerolineae bacterium]
MTEQVTLRDIAQESGYSLASVSLALRNKPGVSEATREHIWRVAKALGYPLEEENESRPVVPPENLGLIVKSEPESPPRANPFYSCILAGIEDACRQAEINLLYARISVNANNYPVQIPPLLSNENLDGLFIIGAFLNDDFTVRVGALKVPVVLVDAYAVSADYDAVVSDNFSGAYTAVRYLIEKGHRHIGMLGGCQSTYPSLKERRRGYEQALRDHGISDVYLTRCSLRPDEAFTATQELLEAYPQITAIFGCNDEVSIAAIQAARRMGRRVPEELSIIGYDDIDFAQYVSPPLTTMHVDKVMMGREAVRLLLWRLEHPAASYVTVTVHSPLRERSSVVPHFEQEPIPTQVKR